MKLYADAPLRRARQLAGDLLAGAFALGCVWLARSLHEATMRLAAPGREVDRAAASMAQRLRDAGGAVGDLPLVGDDAGAGFEGAGAAADRLAAAGRAQAEAVESLALLLALAVAVVPIVLLLAVYLPPRVRFVRRATAGRRLLRAGAGPDLFALRALAHQPLHVLARAGDDPVAAWRAGDPVVVRRLADLELREVGIRRP